jgi:hypothetical protein
MEGTYVINVSLTTEEAQYLSVLAAQDMRRDKEWGARIMSHHSTAWEKLLPAWAEENEND